MYDQFNTGIAVTQQSRPRTNLSIDPGELQRCGVTGTIPSAEQGIAMGAMPQPTTVDGGHGGLRTRGDGDGREETTEAKSWFEPVTSEEELSVSDCPGGVCPVPWAIVPTDTSGDRRR